MVWGYSEAGDFRLPYIYVCIHLPGEPVAHNYGLLYINNGLLWGNGIVAYISSYLAIHLSMYAYFVVYGGVYGI